MVTVVIPRSQNEPKGRARVREWVTARWREQHPDWAVVDAVCPTSRWSKGAAANPYLLEAPGNDVVVLADADSYTDPRAMRNAAEAVRNGAGWAVPFTLVKRIGKADTARILAGETLPRPTIERQSRALHGGGIVVADGLTWWAANGLDPRFVGWGGEDSCLGMALKTVAGPPWTPPPTVLWHLWHPASRRPSQPTNDLWNRYRRARRTPGGIAAIIREW